MKHFRIQLVQNNGRVVSEWRVEPGMGLQMNVQADIGDGRFTESFNFVSSVSQRSRFVEVPRRRGSGWSIFSGSEGHTPARASTTFTPGDAITMNEEASIGSMPFGEAMLDNALSQASLTEWHNIASGSSSYVDRHGNTTISIGDAHGDAPDRTTVDQPPSEGTPFVTQEMLSHDQFRIMNAGIFPNITTPIVSNPPLRVPFWRRNRESRRQESQGSES